MAGFWPKQVLFNSVQPTECFPEPLSQPLKGPRKLGSFDLSLPTPYTHFVVFPPAPPFATSPPHNYKSHRAPRSRALRESKMADTAAGPGGSGTVRMGRRGVKPREFGSPGSFPWFGPQSRTEKPKPTLRSDGWKMFLAKSMPRCLGLGGGLLNWCTGDLIGSFPAEGGNPEHLLIGLERLFSSSYWPAEVGREFLFKIFTSLVFL